MNVISNVILSKYKIQCKCKPLSDRSLYMLFSRPVTSDSLQPQGLQDTRPPWPSPSPEVCPSSSPLHQWCHLAISSSDPLLSSCPQSFPESGTFPMSRLFTSGDQNPGASVSASNLSMSIQDWFPLRLTAWISLQPKGLSGVFSSTTVRRHQFFSAWPSLQSSSHNCVCPLGRPWPWLYGRLSVESCLCFSTQSLVCHSFPAKQQSSSDFMAAVTTCSDFRAQEEETYHCFYLFPSICHKVMGLDAMILWLVAQSCLTLCDPMDCSPLGSSVHGILLAGMLKWVAILFSRGWSWPRDQTHVSCLAGEFFTIWATRKAMILVFLIFSFKTYFSLSSFTLIKRFFSSSSLSAITVVSSAYLRLLMFPPPMLIPACNASSLAFLMMCSVYKLNKQGDSRQPCRTYFSILNQSVVPHRVLTVSTWPVYRFLRRHIRWFGSSISLRAFHSLLWSTQSKALALSMKQR